MHAAAQPDCNRALRARADEAASAEGGSSGGARAQLAELGKSADVLRKQAASNLRKGLGSLVTSAREKWGGSGGGGGPA